MDLFRKCISSLENILKDTKFSKSQINEIILSGGSSKIPKIQEMIKEFFNGKKLNKSLDPEEANVYGAAIISAFRTHYQNEEINKLTLLEITNHSLGVETIGGVMTVLIPRNSSLPLKKSKNFSTYADNQSCVIIEIFEGERPLTKDNNCLGRFLLEGIPPMPRGMPNIEITLDLDYN